MGAYVRVCACACVILFGWLMNTRPPAHQDHELNREKMSRRETELKQQHAAQQEETRLAQSSLERVVNELHNTMKNQTDCTCACLHVCLCE
jgi:hypothetical protein